MADLPSPLALGLHPRELIRKAVVRVMLENPALRQLLGKRIYASRFEQWLSGELPAAGVYALEEECLDSEISPDPDERRLSLVIELVAMAAASLDDDLDRLSLACESALFSDGAIDSLGSAMTAIVEEKTGKTLPVGKDGRSPADTLILIGLRNTEIGIAVDGDRETGVAILNFVVEYRWPKTPADLPDFIQAASGWDVEISDGRIDMRSLVEFEPAKE